MIGGGSMRDVEMEERGTERERERERLGDMPLSGDKGC